MKVSDVIKELEKLKPDDEIMVAWWDRELVSGWFFEEDLISEDIWNYAVDYFASWDLRYTADEITEMITEIAKEKRWLNQK